MNLNKLRNDAKHAPKFIIELFPGVYVSDTYEMTDSIDAALQYSVGFDNENIKTKYWSGVFACNAKYIMTEL